MIAKVVFKSDDKDKKFSDKGFVPENNWCYSENDRSRTQEQISLTVFSENLILLNIGNKQYNIFIVLGLIHPN